MNKKWLTSTPTLQNQPCNTSCVPTCLAMAFDVPVKTILQEWEDLGIDISGGAYDRDVAYYLATVGIGHHDIPNLIGTALLPGHYVMTVASKNMQGMAHAIYVFIDDSHQATVLDPNNGKEGKEGKEFYPNDWDECYFTVATRLDDFIDIWRL